MKKLIASAALLFAVTSLAAGESIPGWFMSGGGRKNYSLELDTSVRHSGRASARIEPAKPGDNGYGTLMQSFAANNFVGKRVRLTAWVKTEGTTGRTDFWARVQGPSSPGDGPGLGGGHYNLPERSDWTAYDMVFDVPLESSSIQFGVGLDGPGKLWIDDVKIEEVPKTTPLKAGPAMAPQNLDFESR